MRDLFLLDPAVTFLNHGSFGACPRPVFERFQQWQLEMERNPVEFLGRRSAGLLAEARERLGQALGARGRDLVFVTNATTGVNIVARSLALAPGDQVLGTDHEYGACDATWRFVCGRAGAVYRRAEIPLPFEPERFVERVMAAVTPRTKVIFASHITSTSALVFPVAALCAAARERGLTTVIDGAHAPGQVAMDLAAIGADFYTGNAHKWLCAPKGAAFLHARPERQAQLDATVVSWGYVAEAAGHTGFDAYTGRDTFERRLTWQGTRDLSAFLAVPAALDFLLEHDAPARLAGTRALLLEARREVLARNGLASPMPDSALAQLIPIPVRCDDTETLRRRLFDEFRIEVPVTWHAGQAFVRASAALYTTAADARALVDALAALRV